MRFMLIGKATKDSEAGVMPSASALVAMTKFNEEMARAGVLLGGEGLQASSKGARLKFSKGEFTVIDGPFAETKEVIAGFCIIRVKSREEAIEWARRSPKPDGDEDFEVEVRQLFDDEDFGPELAAQIPEVFEQDAKLRDMAAANAKK